MKKNSNSTNVVQLVTKRDKYKTARGGYSRFLDIYCRKCSAHVAIYQKDGPGNLRRMYLDRICAPENVLCLQNQRLSEIPSLICSSCKECLGTPYIYKKEKRKAFRLYQDAITKKIRKKTV